MNQQNTFVSIRLWGLRERVSFIAMVGVIFSLFGFVCSDGVAGEGSGASSEARLLQLEARLNTVLDELAAVKTQLATVQGTKTDTPKHLGEPPKDVRGIPTHHASAQSTLKKLQFGGYGMMDVNLNTGKDGRDQFDLHRLVLEGSYEFSDKIRFQSEVEIEHAFVENSNGELSIEQAFIEFDWKDALNFRVGRMLAPIGIINRWHEPTRFNSVERPSLDHYLIPSTWSIDGIGIFGDLGSTVKYELNAVGGLDASGFSALSGIRGGRIQERSSLNDMAITGRLDWYPLITREVPHNQTLRLGVSGYSGGADNGNQGKDPSINAALRIYSLDADYSIARLDFRGTLVHEFIINAENAPAGTAEEIFGWNTEVAYHWLPKSWRKGNLKHADSTIFVRYDDFNTQYKMPSGRSADPRGDRTEWTVGVAFWPRSNLVLKADYQFKNDASKNDVDDQLNFGIGWQF